MTRARALPLLITGVAAAIVTVYAVQFARVSQTSVGRSDFTATYMGGLLWSQGHRGDLYDEHLQTATHDALIAPDREGNLPFVNPPLAAVVASPLSRLSLPDAYRLWQILQLLCLAAAAALAARVRKAAWPRTAATVLICLAGIGTLAEGLLGQWDGLITLSIAGALWALRGRRRATAGLLLAGGVALAKPHLGLGLASFILAWGERRVIAGAAAAVVIVALGSLAAVGPSGIAGWISADQADATRWELASFLGFNGFWASWIGHPAAAQVLGGICSAAALGACVWAGRRVARQGAGSTDALGGVTALTLVASPHLLTHDLTLLGPAAADRLASGSAEAPAPRWAVAAWVLLAAAAALDLGQQGTGFPGRLVPLALLGVAVMLWRHPTEEPR